MISEAEEECCTSIEQIVGKVLSVGLPVVLYSGFSILHTRFWVHGESELEGQARAALLASPTGEVRVKKMPALQVVRETSRRQSG